MFLGDESDSTRPVLWSVIEDVIHGEAVRVFGSKVVEFFFEENVFQVDVGVDEGEFRIVEGVLEGRSDDLEHGRYASTTGNHTNVTGERRGVLEESLGTTNSDLVADLQERDIAGDVALFVRLRRGRSGFRVWEGKKIP